MTYIAEAQQTYHIFCDSKAILRYLLEIHNKSIILKFFPNGLKTFTPKLFKVQLLLLQFRKLNLHVSLPGPPKEVRYPLGSSHHILCFPHIYVYTYVTMGFNWPVTFQAAIVTVTQCHGLGTIFLLSCFSIFGTQDRVESQKILLNLLTENKILESELLLFTHPVHDRHRCLLLLQHSPWPGGTQPIQAGVITPYGTVSLFCSKSIRS